MARDFDSTDNIDFGDNAPFGAANNWTAFAWIYKTGDTDGTVINKRKGFSAGSNLFSFGTGEGGQC